MLFATLVLLAMISGQCRADPPRRVYALHSGVHIFLAHPDKNHAAKTLRNELQRRGVSERDLIVLDCPFPDASWKNVVPRDGVIMFLDSMTPSSNVAHDAYQRMHDAFQKYGVGPNDDVIWIGHSAGGQMGMTMTHLSADIAKFPKLAKTAKPYRFHTIVTLGTPVGNVSVPAGVQVRQYFSPQDPIVRIVCDFGPWILPGWGYRDKICPCTPSPGKNGLVRCWYDITHPDWLYEPRVLDRLWQDVNGSAASFWQTPRAESSAGGALAQLIGRMLEEEYRVHIEEMPARRGAD
jgi:pimeloyl-ACP methyl ester carboxylesterase